MAQHFSSAWEALAEERILQAQEEGQFENLPGFGRPLEGLDEPHDDLWWVRGKLKREGLSALPPALEIRIQAHKTMQRIATLSHEEEVRHAVEQWNEKLRKLNQGVTWGPPGDVMPLDVNEVIGWWKGRRQPG